VRNERRDYPPIIEPEAVYTALASLQVGDVVPPEIYISDYDTGQIPAWTVHSSEPKGSLLQLTLIDPDAAIQATLWEPAAVVARQVLTGPRQSLATPHYQLKEGYGPKAMMCDLIQQARYVAKRLDHPRASLTIGGGQDEK
jgi:hypothetical protein